MILWILRKDFAESPGWNINRKLGLTNVLGPVPPISVSILAYRRCDTYCSRNHLLKMENRGRGGVGLEAREVFNFLRILSSYTLSRIDVSWWKSTIHAYNNYLLVFHSFSLDRYDRFYFEQVHHRVSFDLMINNANWCSSRRVISSRSVHPNNIYER